MNGDVKLFYVTSFPTDLPATGQGTADFRLKAQLQLGKYWSASAHHTLTSFNIPAGGAVTGTNSGVGLQAPELVRMTHTFDTAPDGQPNQLGLRTRTDRLWVRFSPPSLDITVGRQPVTFGTGLVFTPMDVVNPFSAATIDTEYKPGVDAVRADAYWGVAGRATAVLAWAGAPIHDADRGAVGLDDLIGVVNAQATVGVTDLQLLVGSVRAEPVFGVGVASSIGVVGVHGDATLTLPTEDAAEEDPFVRAVVGADWRPTNTTTLSAEGYYQGFGTNDPDEYLLLFVGERFARGEVWQVGRFYGSLAWAQEISALVSSSIALITNFEDPSMLIAPGLSWSVSNEAAMSVGGFVSLGGRPDLSAQIPELRSEFGTYPPSVFVQLRSYF